MKAFDAKRRKRFLDNLRESGNVTGAARATGVSRQTAYDHKTVDPDFSTAWDQAMEEAIDALEAEARRRSMEGVECPVFHLGQQCGVIRRYSDTLLIFLLKAHRPGKYRENPRTLGPGPELGQDATKQRLSPALQELYDSIVGPTRSS